jgi:imidazolonepropionase
MKQVVYGTLVTLAGPQRPRIREELRQLSVIENGAMVIDGQSITWVGAKADLPDDKYETIDHTGKIVTPGLIDAHTHPIFADNRCNEFGWRCEGKTYQEIAASGGGILSTVKATRAASQQELEQAGRRHLRWMLGNGTTTLEAKSGYGLSTEAELKMLRAIRTLNEQGPQELVPTFLGAHAIPPEHRDHPEEYERLLIDTLIPEVAKNGLAEFADAFLEDRYFTKESCRKILTAAKQDGLQLRMHVDQLTLSGGAELAAELNAKTADHLELTEDAGIQALKAANVQPVLLPGSVYALGLNHYPRARAMIDAGLAVVLATDFNPGSSPVASLPYVMSLACTQMKMTPAESLTATTVNAAYSLNREDRGTLEVGRRADFVLWDCERPEEIPYWVGAKLVEAVYIKGKRVLG